MAQCVNCKKRVDCDCVLFEGKYCSTCYPILLDNSQIVRRVDNHCSQTIEELERKKTRVPELFADNKAKRMHYNAIINSQIKQINSDPCKYYDKLSFI